MIEYLGMLITSPKNLVRILLAERRGPLLGFTMVLLSSLVLSLNLSYILIMKTLGFIGVNIPFIRSVSVIGIIIGLVLMNIIAWLLLGLILYLFDRALDGKASLESILLIYSFQWAPLFIIGFLSPVFYYLDMITSILILVLVVALALIWGYIIVLMGNAIANDFSIAKSFLASILQLLIVFGVIFYILVMLGVVF